MLTHHLLANSAPAVRERKCLGILPNGRWGANAAPGLPQCLACTRQVPFSRPCDRVGIWHLSTCKIRNRMGWGEVKNSCPSILEEVKMRV